MKAGEHKTKGMPSYAGVVARALVAERAKTIKYREKCKELSAQVRRLQSTVEVQAGLLRERA